jgi:hydrogenase maturation protein HypF
VTSLSGRVRPLERRRFRVTGTVQGVGFRPFVYRLATELGLVGFVQNDSAGVLIEAEGTTSQLDELGRRVAAEPPPLARVTSVTATVIPVTVIGDNRRFVIAESADNGLAAAPVSVDTATCPDCLAEVDDPADRRYRYPFTNCTNCGPRYTIVLGVPYDRPATTMAGFVMCPECQKEYDDPGDRRFHAQPNACPTCGPRLSWHQPDGRRLAEGSDALDAAVTALRAGSIVAIKGLGGFHLAADALRETAIAELRRRKARDDKPFAVMVDSVETAHRMCELDAAAVLALTSIRRPIVLAPRLPGSRIATGVAPGLPELGLLLPYTPLHHLLITAMAGPVVMTSGNLSDDPIAHTDDDAVARLGPMIDGLLTHDRPIHIRCDDSVLRAGSGGLQLLRRSRGYAPEPMTLPGEPHRLVLAVGAELKNTISVAKDGWVVASHHIGDLEHLATYQSWSQAVGHLPRLYGVIPDVVAHDLHPEYLSTKAALEMDLPAWGIQHHHAHIASCLAEHGRTGPVLGLAFDGLGFGPDGTLWGGEFLVASMDACRRVGHLRPVALPGGSAAIREPWRMAVSWTHAAMGADQAHGLRLDDRTPALIDLIERGPGLTTTSMGRLFDAVAALIGVRRRITYEGQAAIELEALANRAASVGVAYPVALEWSGDILVLDPSPLIAAVISAMEKGEKGSQVAASFHEGVAAGAVSAAVQLARRHGMNTVALSGGVFQNGRLTRLVVAGLEAEGLDVLTHHQVPANDGGISIGQAAIASTAAAVPVVTLG